MLFSAGTRCHAKTFGIIYSKSIKRSLKSEVWCKSYDKSNFKGNILPKFSLLTTDEWITFSSIRYFALVSHLFMLLNSNRIVPKQTNQESYLLSVLAKLRATYTNSYACSNLTQILFVSFFSIFSLILQKNIPNYVPSMHMHDNFTH